MDGETTPTARSMQHFSDDALTALAWDAQLCGWEHIHAMVDAERQRRQGGQ